MKGIYMYLIKKIVAGVITFGLIGTIISLFGNHKIVRQLITVVSQIILNQELVKQQLIAVISQLIIQQILVIMFLKMVILLM